jgi:hypothetical protein
MWAGNCAAQYAGSAVCGKCHAKEFAAQSATGHARALSRSTSQQPGDWAFGAGNQAVTFVSRLNDNDYLEHGESWYRASQSFAITPGHENTRGLRYRVFDPSAGILKCFACHSTGPLSVGDDGSITPSELGVRCEDCHGPGAAHAANPAKTHPRGLAQLGGQQMNALCGECHRVQSGVGDGSNLLDPWNARHQPLLLAASGCFQKSAEKLKCVSCHSPHQPLAADRAAYNAVCSGCHANPRHSTPVKGGECTGCHMPAVRINANLVFANHRIGVYSASDPLSPVSAK